MPDSPNYLPTRSAHKLPTARLLRRLKTTASEVVRRVPHGRNAGFSRSMVKERAAAAPGPDGSSGARRDVVRLLGVGRLVEITTAREVSA